MQDIRQETLNECTRAEQSASVVLWGNRPDRGRWRNVIFFCNEQNEKGEPVTWQGRQYQPYPIQGSGFELNGKGTSTRPTLTVSNLYGMVTGMAEDLQSLVGGTVVRRKVYAPFSGCGELRQRKQLCRSGAGGDRRWRIEQCSELSAVSASLYCPRRRKRMALFFRDVSCWPTPAPGPIAVTSAVIAVRPSRMTSQRPISRPINAANA